MRVLVITNAWPDPDRPPFFGVMIKRQVDSLPALGVAADVWVIRGTDNPWAYAQAAGRVLRLNWQRRRWDVIHAQTGHAGLIASLQVRYPVIVSYMGYDLDVPGDVRESSRTRLERALFRQLSRLVAAVVVKSRRGYAALPVRRRAAVVPNGVDLSVFHPVDRAEARRRLGWSADQSVVLFAADPKRPIKRYALAEAAVTHARAAIGTLRLQVAAAVPSDEMPLWMSAADCLLLTSSGEGSPNVIKEAMACNLPIVSVDVGDVREVVSGTENSWICSDDPRELGRAIAAVCRSGSRSNGRRRVEPLALPSIALRVVEVYRRASSRGPGLLGFLPRAGIVGRVQRP